jgi:hypothetical protein
MSPDVLWKRLVSTMYLNSAQSVFGVVSSFMMLMSLPPVLLRNVCLASWCAEQCSRKCCMDSSAVGMLDKEVSHFSQCGVNA